MKKKEVSKSTIDKIKNFIINNDLTFQEGNRNSNCVVLSGYCLHIGCNDVTTIIRIIYNVLDSTDDFEKEFLRVFDFSQKNNYGDWWTSEEASCAYNF